jgi:hypothetical protein
VNHRAELYVPLLGCTRTWSVQVDIGLSNGTDPRWTIQPQYVCEESSSIPVSSFTCSPPFWSFPSVPIAYNSYYNVCPPAGDPSFPCNGSGSTGTVAVTITQ